MGPAGQPGGAQGDRAARVDPGLDGEADAGRPGQARGQAQAIATVYRAIHDGNPDQRLLAYKYLEMLPELAKGSANKMWIVPSELGKALEGVGGFFANASGGDVAKRPVEEPPLPLSGPDGNGSVTRLPI